MEQQISLRNQHTSRQATAFRVLRVLLILGLLAGGASQLFGITYQVSQFARLGYPLHLMHLIGAAKVTAGVVVLLHRWPLLTVAAYVGGFIVSVCAVVAHFAAADPLYLCLNPLFMTALCLACALLDPTLRCLRS